MLNMQLGFLMVCFVLKPAFLQEIHFQSGGVVMLVGEMVDVVCNGSLKEESYFWIHPNHTKHNSSHYRFSVTTADSGVYICSCRNGTECYNKLLVNVTLTVVERLSNIWVSSVPQSLATMEGQRVTLNCEATSYPPTVSWTWTRLDEKGVWENVSAEQALTLSTAGESGQYRCRGYSFVQGRTQTENSSIHTVFIVSFPWSGSVKAGIVGLVLALFANVFLLLVILWLWRQQTNDKATPKTINAVAKGFRGPANASKRSQSQAQTEDVGDIYMNC